MFNFFRKIVPSIVGLALVSNAAIGCLDTDSATIYMPAPNQEIVDDGPVEMQPDDEIFPLDPAQPEPQPEPVPEPPPVVEGPPAPPPPPPPAWTKPLLLIPHDEIMVRMFKENFISEFFWESFGTKVELLPVGTDVSKGIPLRWNYSNKKYLGQATMRGGCYWTRCHGRAHIWMRAEFQDYEFLQIQAGKWNGFRPTLIHEIGHIITGLGVRSGLDSLPAGHLERENILDPSGFIFFNVKDGIYFCDRAMPCQFRPERAVYVGSEPPWMRWPGLFPDAGAPDAAPDAGFDYFRDQDPHPHVGPHLEGNPYFTIFGSADAGIPPE